jgi:hypothetical protein
MTIPDEPFDPDVGYPRSRWSQIAATVILTLIVVGIGVDSWSYISVLARLP